MSPPDSKVLSKSVIFSSEGKTDWTFFFKKNNFHTFRAGLCKLNSDETIHITHGLSGKTCFWYPQQGLTKKGKQTNKDRKQTSKDRKVHCIR